MFNFLDCHPIISLLHITSCPDLLVLYSISELCGWGCGISPVFFLWEKAWCLWVRFDVRVAATMFTEGELPYQCICCHQLHYFSGNNLSFLFKAWFEKKANSLVFKSHTNHKCVVLVLRQKKKDSMGKLQTEVTVAIGFHLPTFQIVP